MSTTVEFADVLAALVPHVRGRIDPGVVVDVRVPTPLPDALVVMTRTGGAATTRVSEAAHVSVDSWGGDNVEAHANAAALAQQVRAVLHAMAGVIAGVTVYRVDDVAGPYDNPDPATGRPRVSFTVAVHVRGHPAP